MADAFDNSGADPKRNQQQGVPRDWVVRNYLEAFGAGAGPATVRN